MKRKQSRPPRVRRITIDERLDDRLVKIGIANLSDGYDDLKPDALDGWGDEELKLIRPRGFLKTFELRKGHPVLKRLAKGLGGKSDDTNAKQAFWRSLEEGQVYLVGEIAVSGGERSDPESITVRPGAFDLIRIDRIPTIKQRHKELYSVALKEGS